MKLITTPEDVKDWFLCKKKPVIVKAVKMKENFVVQTLEGIMRGKAGDFLICGIQGELYAIDEEIFHQTYEVIKKGDKQ